MLYGTSVVPQDAHGSRHYAMRASVVCVQQCIPSQFDFSVPFQQQLWLDCCDNVLQEAKRDLACEKDQW